MFGGMALGAITWFIGFIICCILCIDQNPDAKLNQLAVIIWIIIFSFIGSIIGYLINLNISFTWSM